MTSKETTTQEVEYLVVETPKDLLAKGAAVATAVDEAPTGAPAAVAPKEASKTLRGDMVSLLQLFRFADKIDVGLMVVGALGAFATGAAGPLRILLFGDIISALNPTDGGANMLSTVSGIALKLVWMGLGLMVTGFLQVACWSITSSRQGKRMREAYVRAILTKEVAWFDVNDPATLATKVTESTMLIQEGMGRKIGDGCNFASMAITGITIGIANGWKLGLIVLAFTPLIAIGTYVMMKSMSAAVQRAVHAYGQAGAIADEALSNIRTVHMFNSVAATSAKYDVALQAAEAAGIRKGLVAGLGNGLVFFIIFATYVVGIYFGAVFVANDNLGSSPCQGSSGGCYDGGKVLIVFFGVIMGAMAIGQAGPCIEAVVTARAAAFEAFRIIDQPSKIDPLSTAGETLVDVLGDIELHQVAFAYPTRPDIQVCQGYTLRIAAGEKVALVGPSGSGKSTIVSLLERFYDPTTGVVTLDGVDLRQLNVAWLRQQIGLVGQEPCLFADSIAANIRHGKPDATLDEIHAAAKMANAYDFIVGFPEGFDTDVGERGAQLSGGQKQRIAIARAIIKNPAVLLLDEATSALDTESERIVQASLDRLLATRQRTTIIVAHRLSTIRNADRIVVLNHGKVQEEGTHDALMVMEGGHYKRLVEAQRHATSDAPEDTLALASESNMATPRKSSRLTSKGDAAELAQVATDDNTSTNDDGDQLYHVSAARIWKLSHPERWHVCFGAIGAAVTGATFPVWGILLSKSIVLFFNFNVTADEMKHQGFLWAMYFLALGVAYALSAVVHNYCFSIVSEKLTARLRSLGFAAMLRQEIGWYDLQPSGVLTTRLATETTLIQRMTSDFLRNTVSTIVTLVVAIGISFYFSWQMTLAVLAVFPLMGFASAIRHRSLQTSGQNGGTKTHQGDTLAGALLAESINSIRTIASFGMERAINATFIQYIVQSTLEDAAAAYRLGVIYGVSQGIMFLALAFLFWFGGWLIHHGHISFEAMFMVLMALMMSSFGIGTAIQGLGGRDKAQRAAAHLFETIDRVPTIDCTATDDRGDRLAHVVGTIQFKNVQFAYPTRPHSLVYKNYSLTVESGTTVALVGASGSGKSTAISLLERFYDPLAGAVFLDGVDIKTLNLHWLRDHISLVGQEPVLFAGTIADNIGTGKPGSTLAEIEEAAKKANAHDFIVNFPDGYATQVGDRGVQVSGGQKQRIAIARAILRDPAVLLLDEATSALDNESERIVQASLDALLQLKKRTTIVVAHRLSTIRNADLIAVCHEGGVVEQGTHDQLMLRPDGLYKTLVSRQVETSVQ
ncbi:Aste57867_8609 [Aphanomyces stellatus]|uniref:Aste57867_8609 protein n=1 Tax=Aphanomyces stellatus TaxID=120398 RepID=A0A485KKS4_9STRA|nr:hypothetical protein As57867_008575 [Aphanomyces stellatus]VFT85495.1 Aste57867_8609 [Aphanomyces stellatus]